MQHPDDAPFSSLSSHGWNPCGLSDAIDLSSQKMAIFELDRLRELLHRSGEKRVTLFGTALAFLNLLEEVPDLRLELPPGSVVMETGGFKGSGRDIGKSDLYDRLSLHLGVPIDSIWNEYGMTELSSQFYSRGVGRSHRAPPWMRFQIIDPETNKEASSGAIGLLRIIDLANLWSVLAVLTQDLAIAQPDGGFLLLGRDPDALPRGCSRAMDELLQFVPRPDETG